MAQTLKDIFVVYKVFERSWSGRDANRIEKQRDELEAAIKAWAKELVEQATHYSRDTKAKRTNTMGSYVDGEELIKLIDDAS